MLTYHFPTFFGFVLQNGAHICGRRQAVYPFHQQHFDLSQVNLNSPFLFIMQYIFLNFPFSEAEGLYEASSVSTAYLITARMFAAIAA